MTDVSIWLANVAGWGRISSCSALASAVFVSCGSLESPPLSHSSSSARMSSGFYDVSVSSGASSWSSPPVLVKSIPLCSPGPPFLNDLGGLYSRC